MTTALVAFAVLWTGCTKPEAGAYEAAAIGLPEPFIPATQHDRDLARILLEEAERLRDEANATMNESRAPLEYDALDLALSRARETLDNDTFPGALANAQEAYWRAEGARSGIHEMDEADLQRVVEENRTALPERVDQLVRAIDETRGHLDGETPTLLRVELDAVRTIDYYHVFLDYSATPDPSIRPRDYQHNSAANAAWTLTQLRLVELELELAQAKAAEALLPPDDGWSQALETYRTRAGQATLTSEERMNAVNPSIRGTTTWLKFADEAARLGWTTAAGEFAREGMAFLDAYDAQRTQTLADLPHPNATWAEMVARVEDPVDAWWASFAALYLLDAQIAEDLGMPERYRDNAAIAALVLASAANSLEASREGEA